MNPARQENVPTGKVFFLPSKHWFPSGWTTSMITTGSEKAEERIRCDSDLQLEEPELFRDNKGPEVSYRLVGSRCCERPGGSCSPSPGSSSCIRPPPGWCRCRTSDRSRSGRATPTPIGPGPRFLEDRPTKPNQPSFDLDRRTKSLHPVRYPLLLR